jgi:hypothetical protein
MTHSDWMTHFESKRGNLVALQNARRNAIARIDGEKASRELATVTIMAFGMVVLAFIARTI